MHSFQGLLEDARDVVDPVFYAIADLLVFLWPGHVGRRRASIAMDAILVGGVQTCRLQDLNPSGQADVSFPKLHTMIKPQALNEVSKDFLPDRGH